MNAWRLASAMKLDHAIAPDRSTVARVKKLLHLELVGIVLILSCAAMMARGVDSFA